MINVTQRAPDMRSQGIQINVPDKFQQTGLFLTQDGFIAIL